MQTESLFTFYVIAAKINKLPLCLIAKITLLNRDTRFQFLYINKYMTIHQEKLDKLISKANIFNLEQAMEIKENRIVETDNTLVFIYLENNKLDYRITPTGTKMMLKTRSIFLTELLISRYNKLYLFILCYHIDDLELSTYFNPSYTILKYCKKKDFFLFYKHLLTNNDILGRAFYFEDEEIIKEYIDYFEHDTSNLLKVKKLKYFKLIESRIKDHIIYYIGSIEILEYVMENYNIDEYKILREAVRLKAHHIIKKLYISYPEETILQLFINYKYYHEISFALFSSCKETSVNSYIKTWGNYDIVKFYRVN